MLINPTCISPYWCYQCLLEVKQKCKHGRVTNVVNCVIIPLFPPIHLGFTCAKCMCRIQPNKPKSSK